MKNENGQALVEAALSLPFIVVMLLGMTEIGKMVYCAIEVTNSARAAAQYATMNGGAFSTNSSGMDVTGMLTAAQSDSGNLGTSVSFPTTPTYSCACADGSTTYSCNTGSAIPSGCSGSHLIITVTVHTQGTFTPDIKVPGLSTSYTLHGLATEEVLQ
jgi:hypothetical protein